jgi:peptide-methionine (S)-S-oxide reductase
VGAAATTSIRPLLLEEREVGPRVALTPQDEPGFRHRPSAVKEHHNEPDDKEHTDMVTEKAILAGGCFWGMQDLIRKLDGVVSTRVGYSGGDVPNATYRNHGTHAEAIEIVFDPERISYRDLLEFFFQVHDPSTKNRQGNDIGTSYRSAIFYLDDEQRRVAQDTIADVDASGLWPGKVVTEVEPAGPFWEAEPEHQDYLERYPNGYTCHFVRPGWRLPKRAEATAS